MHMLTEYRLPTVWGAGIPCSRPMLSCPGGLQSSRGWTGATCFTLHSSDKSHMWSCRKTDAVFPFVKSSCWKVVSFAMYKSSSNRPEEKGGAFIFLRNILQYFLIFGVWNRVRNNDMEITSR